MEVPEENTETVTVVKEGDRYQIIVQHDQSGSAYGMPLSESAYEQLYEYFREESEKRLSQLEEDLCRESRKFYPDKDKFII